MLKEPSDLKQLEPFFQSLQPKAFKQDQKIYFKCSDEHYQKAIGPVWEWEYYEYKFEALKIRVKYLLYLLLQREKRIIICDCGAIIWRKKGEQYKNLCTFCTQKGE